MSTGGTRRNNRAQGLSAVAGSPSKLCPKLMPGELAAGSPEGSLTGL